MFIRLFLIILIFPTLLFSQEATTVQSKYPGVAVIELFTSQGDINSPPADELLNEIIADATKRNVPVFCLSMHVDFWNRYGWQDPFSAFKYTNRLTNYTSVLGMNETYTPLMILNGRKVLPSTDRKKVFEMIDEELQNQSAMHPEFTYQVFDDTLDISYEMKNMISQTKAGSDKYLNVAIVEKGLSTKVTKGDNEGKTLINDNVTRLFFTSDLKFQKGLVRVPLKSIKKGPDRNIILFVQDKHTRKVLGATSSSFHN